MGKLGFRDYSLASLCHPEQKQSKLCCREGSRPLPFCPGSKGEILRHFVPQNDSGKLTAKLGIGGEPPQALVKLLGAGNWFPARPQVKR